MSKQTLLVLVQLAGAVSGFCGVFLLLPWYRGAATYTNPKLAFFGAVFMVGYGGIVFGWARARSKRVSNARGNPDPVE